MTESPTYRAYQAARDDLRRYQPRVETVLGVTLVPRRRAAAPRVAASFDLAHYPSGGPLLSAASALRAGSASATALVRQALARIEEWNPRTAGFVHVLTDEALREAAACDADAARGQWRGLLHGLPVTVKDNLHVAGAPTRAGSDAYQAAPTEDAAAVARLRAAGAIMLAKVTTHEFALGVTAPQARHPRDAARIPGGSSGGSAISVAVGAAYASLATDTRASIRVPASLCGVVGFKPTFGVVPTAGLVWLSWTVDTLGVLAGSVGDATLALDVISGGDLHLGQANTRSGVARLRVGLPRAAFIGADAAVAAAVEAGLRRLEAAGAVVVPVEHPTEDELGWSNAAGLIVSRAEALEYHRTVGTNWRHVWVETRDQFEATAQLQLSDYLLAQRFRADLASTMLAEMQTHNLAALAMPSTLVTAPLAADAEQYFTRLSKLAIPWSILGWPVLSVPASVPASALPVGVQLVAPPFEEPTLVQLGRAVETGTG